MHGLQKHEMSVQTISIDAEEPPSILPFIRPNAHGEQNHPNCIFDLKYNMKSVRIKCKCAEMGLSVFVCLTVRLIKSASKVVGYYILTLNPAL